MVILQLAQALGPGRAADARSYMLRQGVKNEIYMASVTLLIGFLIGGLLAFCFDARTKLRIVFNHTIIVCCFVLLVYLCYYRFFFSRTCP